MQNTIICPGKQNDRGLNKIAKKDPTIIFSNAQRFPAG